MDDILSDDAVMTKNRALQIKAEIEKTLKRHKLWYDVEYVFKSGELDGIKIKNISIKVDAPVKSRMQTHDH